MYSTEIREIIIWIKTNVSELLFSSMTYSNRFGNSNVRYAGQYVDIRVQWPVIGGLQNKYNDLKKIKFFKLNNNLTRTSLH